MYDSLQEIYSCIYFSDETFTMTISYKGCVEVDASTVTTANDTQKQIGRLFRFSPKYQLFRKLLMQDSTVDPYVTTSLEQILKDFQYIKTATIMKEYIFLC